MHFLRDEIRIGATCRGTTDGSERKGTGGSVGKGVPIMPFMGQVLYSPD
jgi:hypothetical protein